GPVGAYVLDDPEEIHAGDRGRVRVDHRNGAEVDVVDREIFVTVDEIDEALADTVDSGNVELHRPRTHGNRPRAKVERAPEGRVGIAYANRHCADDRPFDGLHGARYIGGLRIDDDVHRALPIELDFARAVVRDRPESHCLEHAAHRLRLRRREFDELESVDAERVLRLGYRFAVQG